MKSPIARRAGAMGPAATSALRAPAAAARAPGALAARLRSRGALSGPSFAAPDRAAATAPRAAAAAAAAAAGAPPPALEELTAVGPLDGRYASKVAGLRPIFSEFGLIRFRVAVECAWLRQLSELPGVPEVPPLAPPALALLDQLSTAFTVADAAAVKAVEATTNHDVKAVEYVLKERFAADPQLAAVLEFTHFACTSEDINNLAHGLMLAEARTELVLPAMDAVVDAIAA
jgi:adenylosuccinate lyase